MKNLRNHALSSYELYKFLINLDIDTDWKNNKSII